MTELTPIRHFGGGCKCRQCYGLAEYLDDLGVPNELPATSVVGPPTRRFYQPTAASTDASGALDAVPCDGSMVCGCVTCAADRSTSVRRGSRDVPQPWHTKGPPERALGVAA